MQPSLERALRHKEILKAQVHVRIRLAADQRLHRKPFSSPRHKRYEINRARRLPFLLLEDIAGIFCSSYQVI